MQNSNQIQWPGWKTVRVIGHGSYGTVYEIERDLFGKTEKAALKHIGIPQNPSDIDEMHSDGYDDASITATFRSHLQSIVNEYSLMRELNGSANVVNCDDVQYVQRDDGIGWDIYIKMELLTPLANALPQQIPVEMTVKLAKDICKALVLCNQFHIIHRDIKPQNIFVSPLGDYKLGDFGIAKTIEQTMGGTKTGTYKYMAPEIYHNQPYGSGADIYSLGLVLYWMLNRRRLPFVPLPPISISAGMDEEAKKRRLSGEPLPPPVDGSEELKRIVQKACAFRVDERYHSASEMLADLEALKDDRGEQPIPSWNCQLPSEQETDMNTVTNKFDVSGAASNNDSTVFLGCQPNEFTAKDRESTIGALSERPKKQASAVNTDIREKTARPSDEQDTIDRQEEMPRKRKKPLILIAAISFALILAGTLLAWKPWASGGAGNDPAGQIVSPDTSKAALSSESKTRASTEASIPVTIPDNSPFDTGIHLYEIVPASCSWTQAQQEAVQCGGHLVCFETQAEYYSVLSQLEKEAPELRYLWIGMHRETNSTEYYWVDTNNRPFGTSLNTAGCWNSDYWQDGEPTLEWDGKQETCGLLQFNEKKYNWGWNDAGEVLSDSFNGMQGYIIEYETAFTPGIHTYKFVHDACSWSESQQKAKQLGGHLVCFETLEEYQYVLSKLESEAPELKYLRIGMRRADDGKNYYWVDADNQFYGPSLNATDTWYKDSWHTGEPTFEWEGKQEAYGILFYLAGAKQWGWTDVSDNIHDDTDRDTVGFIVEFE